MSVDVCVCECVCSTQPLTHALFPAVCVCVPVVTHCVSQHPSDICRMLHFHAALMTSPGMQTERSRQAAMMLHKVSYVEVAMNADQRRWNFIFGLCY